MRPALALLSVLLAVGASAAAGAAPRTYADARSAVKGGEAPDAVYRSLAFEERASISDRVKSARALAKAADDPRAKVGGYVLEARLQGVGGKAAGRKKAFVKAKRLAKKHKLKKAARKLDAALDADATLAKLRRATRKRERKPPARLGPKDKALRKAMERALSSYSGLGDTPALARAKLWLSRLDVTASSPRKKARKRLEALAEEDADNRDLAAVREQALRTLATLHQRQGRWREAALASLRADRATAPPPRKAMWDAPEASPYRRSKQSSALCLEAKQARVDCAALEVERFGDRSFYDFSSGKKLRRFSREKAKHVLAEYESTLRDCVLTSEDLTELDTEIQLLWTIDPDGMVHEFDVRPRRARMGKTGACFDEAFARVRYPRFRGAPRPVELTWDVDAPADRGR